MRPTSLLPAKHLSRFRKCGLGMLVALVALGLSSPSLAAAAPLGAPQEAAPQESAQAALSPTAQATTTPTAQATTPATASATSTPMPPATTPRPTPETLSTPEPSTVAPTTEAGSAPAAPQAAVPEVSLAQRGPYGAYMGQGLASTADSAKAAKSARIAAAPMAVAAAGPSGVLGVDVSGHQPNIDWKQQAGLGAAFAYVKASEGIDFKSPTFSDQYSGSYNAGLIRGAYHFALPPESSGAAQANYFVKNGGGWSADGMTLPPLLDIEYNPYYQYGNACYNMSASQMVAWIKDFSNRMLALTKRLPMIYTTADWWQTCTGNSQAFANQPLHIAAYPNDLNNNFQYGPGSLPGGWPVYSVWQFSDNWKLTGDSNVWNGTYASLQKFARGDGATPPQPGVTDGIPLTVGIGDFNSDKRSDLLQTRQDGTLWFYPGNNDGTFGKAIQIGTGFNVYTKLVALGDFNGDGKPDFAGIRKDGSWWFYGGTGVVDANNKGYLPAISTPTQWGQFSSVTGIGDLTGDGKPDVAAVGTDGTLWLFPGTGVVSATKSGVGAGIKIGNGGWGAYSGLVRGGDINKDGNDDFLAVGTDGSLWMYPGTGNASSISSGYSARIKLGNSGWDKFSTVVGTGDLNGDGQPDIIGRYADSSYVFYAGSAAGKDGYAPARKIGTSGWDRFKQVLSVGDFDGDGKPDLLAVRNDGVLFFYAGDGVGGYQPGRQIGTGWGVYTGIYGVGDYNGDGRPDLLAVRSDGSLWFYAGTGKVYAADQGYAPALKVGRSGWNAYSQIIGTGDISGDRYVDLLGIRPDGSVWLYAGNGNVSATSEGYAPAVKAPASLLAGVSQVAAVFDFDADGRNDVVATKSDGSLWFYAGTGKLTDQYGFAAGRKIGNSGWNAYLSLLGVGDSDGDGAPDMVGINRNGSLWFYAGTKMQAQAITPGVRKGNIP